MTLCVATTVTECDTASATDRTTRGGRSSSKRSPQTRVVYGDASAVLIDVAADTMSASASAEKPGRTVLRNIFPSEVRVEVGDVVVTNTDGTYEIDKVAKMMCEVVVPLPEIVRDGDHFTVAEGQVLTLDTFLRAVRLGVLAQDPELSGKTSMISKWFPRHAWTRQVNKVPLATTQQLLRILVEGEREYLSKVAGSPPTTFTSVKLSPGKREDSDLAPTLETIGRLNTEPRSADSEDTEDAISCSQSSVRGDQRTQLASPQKRTRSSSAKAAESRTNVSKATDLVLGLYHNSHHSNQCYHSFTSQFMLSFITWLTTEQAGLRVLESLSPRQFNAGIVTLPANFFPPDNESWRSYFVDGSPYCYPAGRLSHPPGRDGKPPLGVQTEPKKKLAGIDWIASVFQANHPSRMDLCSVTYFQRAGVGKYAVPTKPQNSVYAHLLDLHRLDRVSCNRLLANPPDVLNELTFEVQLSDSTCQTITIARSGVVTLESLINDLNVKTPLTINIEVRPKAPAVHAAGCLFDFDTVASAVS